MSKDFTEFLSYFQELILPVIFQEGSEHEYSMKNDALPDKCIDQFILPSMDFEADDMTEFVPCGFWKTTHGQIVVIIWCARLLRYSFLRLYLISMVKHMKAWKSQDFLQMENTSSAAW